VAHVCAHVRLLEFNPTPSNQCRLIYNFTRAHLTNLIIILREARVIKRKWAGGTVWSIGMCRMDPNSLDSTSWCKYVVHQMHGVDLRSLDRILCHLHSMCKTTREVLQSYHLMPYCPASEHHILVYPPIHIPFSNCVHLNISDIARVRSCQYIDPIFHPHIKTSHLLKKRHIFFETVMNDSEQERLSWQLKCQHRSRPFLKYKNV